MPFAHINGHRCYYRIAGADAAPPVFLSHALGTDHGLWDGLAAALGPHYKVIRYDTRGHGASEPTPGDYSIESLSRDLLALADTLGIDAFALCGLSLGGMIGQWLGANAPERLTRLVLANTTARVEHPPAMQERRVAVLERGMTAIAETVLGRFFSPRFLQSGDPAIDWARRTLVASDPVGYAGACAAIRDMDLRTDLARIAVPPLVIAGNFDVPMPWEGHGRLLAESIPGARAVRLDGGHLTNLERPQEFAAAVLDWLAH